jgi:hypothetical protein
MKTPNDSNISAQRKEKGEAAASPFANQEKLS